MKELKVISLFVLIVFFAISCFAKPLRIHVAADGDDSGTGSISQPFQTISRAKQEVRKWIRSGYVGKIEVIISGGVYRLAEPLHFSTEDSGNKNLMIVYRAKKGEMVIISGGITITDIRTKSGVWYVELPEMEMHHAYDLYVNGRRAVRARTPNSGMITIHAVKQKVLLKGSGRVPQKAIQTITVPARYISELARLTRRELARVRFVAFHKWDNTIRYIDGIDTSINSFTTTGKGMKPWNPLRKGTRIFFENYRAALDSAGEWLQDNSVFLYMPLPGELVESAKITIPVLDKLLVMDGRSGIVENIHFKGLRFAHSSAQLSESGFEPNQAASTLEAAIMLNWANNISFTDCEISKVGQYAIWFKKGCRNCSMQRCYIQDMGAGGIRIGETIIPVNSEEQTGAISIDNCIIQSGGYNFPCAVGIWIGQSSHNVITHCDIGDFRYTGISIGWTWGYGKSLASQNEITYNHIHHIGWAVLSDMGGVYTLGVSPGTVVSHNVIHDVYSYGYGGWGLYTDEGSSFIKMENNFVHSTKTGSFHQHYGRENIIRNNVFALADMYQLQVTRVENHCSFHFTNNIVVGERGLLLQGPWDKVNIEMDHNCYWFNENKGLDFAGMSFEEWRTKTGHDTHSIIANPVTLDLKAGTFSLNPEIAETINFKYFDPKQAGVYGDKEWIKRAALPDSIVKLFEQEVNKKRL